MPTTDTLDWWLKTGSIYGLGFVAVAVLVGIVLCGLGFGVWHVLGILLAIKRSIPKVVQAHLGFVNHTKESTERSTVALETLAGSHGTSHNNHRKTQRTLGHVINAAKEAVTCPEVHRHLDRAADELRTD